MQVVPQEVLDRYLKNYSAHDLKIIARERYIALHRLLNAHNIATFTDAQPILLMSAGASGTGKSTHLKESIKNNPKAVLLDSTDLLHQMNAFKHALAQVDDYSGGAYDSAMRQALRDATCHWHLASMYVRDSLLNDCLHMGLPAVLETSAHTTNIAKLFDNVRKQGYAIHLNLYEAPQAVKEQSTRIRFEEAHFEYVEPQSVMRKDAGVTANFLTFAAHADKLAIFWRAANDAAPTPLAMSCPKETSITRTACEGFDRQMADTGITVESLMAYHVGHRQERAAKRADCAPRAF